MGEVGDRVVCPACGGPVRVGHGWLVELEASFLVCDDDCGWRGDPS